MDTGSNFGNGYENTFATIRGGQGRTFAVFDVCDPLEGSVVRPLPLPRLGSGVRSPESGTTRVSAAVRSAPAKQIERSQPAAQMAGNV